MHKLFVVRYVYKTERENTNSKEFQYVTDDPNILVYYYNPFHLDYLLDISI
jgi:hypothetical protein